MTPFYLTLLLTIFENHLAQMNPAWLDVAKIFAGSIGWIGGLALFVWLRERKLVKTATTQQA